MNDIAIQNTPEIHSELLSKSEEIGFTMPSDLLVGSLLCTLISSKPGGKFLELGTGIGLSLSWMVSAMDPNSELITVDNDKELINIAKRYFEDNSRVNLVCQDAGLWINENSDLKFDLIFADAWPGKYSHLDQVLSMVATGGFYVIDDMSKQANWPDGHENHVAELIAILEGRNDIRITKLNWSTGLIIAVKI